MELLEERECVARATRAYGQYCRYHGIIFAQPSNSSRLDDEGIVHLVNGKGPLARYKVLPSGRLRRLESRD